MGNGIEDFPLSTRTKENAPMTRVFPYWQMLLFPLLAFLVLTGCEAEQTELSGRTMGTTYSIKYIASDGTPGVDVIREGVAARLVVVNNQMSTYIPDSEISRFNSSREVGVPFAVSHELVRVVTEAQRINTMTEGGLDITIGPLVNLWGFGPEKRPEGSVPDDASLEERRRLVGMDKLEIQGDALIKKIPGLYIDLSAIAKGYGVDVLADYLASQGIEHYMVDIGGEVRARGKNSNGAPWRIAIEKPADDPETKSMVQIVVPLDAMAMATSGSYRNYFEKDGERYSHTIDPASGRPIKHSLVSVSVLAENCMTADGLATGLNVLGAERALTLADRLNIPAYFVVKTPNGFDALYSLAFAPYLTSKDVTSSTVK